MCQQSSSPHTNSSVARHVETALKVPFGIRDGRLLRPEQVEAGLACRCLCPGCGAPLMAKAGNSQYRRPHFAHLADTDCRTGYETALHLKAKELIAEHARLWLPAWDGEVGMPNPPALADDDGEMVLGEKIDFPSREVALSEVQLEVRCGDYVPDIVANDEDGELLIEIRVTHAVDELKRQRIQSEGRRLVEIDLSRLDHNIVSDESRLRHAVLEDLGLRVWLSCPTATDAWREVLRALKAELARRNEDLTRKRAALDAAARAQQLARERTIAEEKARKQNRERLREQERAPHQKALDALPELVSPERVELLIEKYAERDGSAITQLLGRIPDEAARREVQLKGPNSWIYTVHPIYWQAAVYNHFILARSPGEQFNNRDAARWVMQEFGREELLYSLFRAQYAFRRRARAVGINKRTISFWAFTDLENQQIPDFYKPINSFIDRLIYLGVLERVPEILGQVRISLDDGAG